MSTNASSLLVVVLQLGFVVGAVASAVLGISDRVHLRKLVLISATGAAAANVANVAIVPLVPIVPLGPVRRGFGSVAAQRWG